MGGRALLAWNLRRLRVGRGLSQEKLAVDSGAASAHISEIETQKVGATVDVLDKLASALGVEIAEFFKAPEGEEPKPLRQGRKPSRSE